MSVRDGFAQLGMHGKHAGPGGHRPVALGIQRRARADFSGGFIQRNGQDTGGQHLFVVRLANLFPTTGDEVVRDPTQGVHLLLGICYQTGGSQNNHGSIVQGVAERRPCENKPIDQRHSHANGNAAGERPQHPAYRRAMDVNLIARSSICRGDDIRLAVDGESHVADVRFIKDGVDPLLVIDTPFGMAQYLRPVRRCDCFHDVPAYRDRWYIKRSTFDILEQSTLNFAIALDRESETPLRQQIYGEWRKGILAGRFRPGDRVPSTRELALALGVSRGTVSEAWEQLIAEGYFETAQGSGTFVCQELPENLQISKSKPLAASRTVTRLDVKLSRYGAGLNRDFRRPRPAPGVIAFLPGIPDCDHFPFPLWRRLLARHLRDATPAVFDYAEGSAGHQPLREEIAAYVARTRAVKCTSDQVIVVNGSQQALALCAQLLIEPSDRVAFENPGYQGARRIFEAHGARLLPCPIDPEGLAIDCLEEAARLAYVTPSHQYPTGISMSLMRRFELLGWAREYGAAIIEDDYSSEYRYSGPPLPSLQGLANGVPVLYIGTFSKVMFPGLRIGYLIVPRELAARFERAKWLADRHTPVLEQCALADFIGEGHLDRHIRRMRRLYGRRREVLIESLRRHFGDRVRIMGAEAGMHSMVRFDDGRVELRARLNGVHLVSSAGYYLAHPPAKEFLMGFSAIGERAIREGVKRLAL